MALPITRRSYIPTLLAILAYTSIGVLLFPPISGDRIHFGRVDNLLILYTLEWERYALLADPGQFFDGIMFHSLGPSLFFTHLVLGGLPIYMAGYLFGSAITGYQAVVMCSPIFNAVAMYFLARQITDRHWSAFQNAGDRAYSRGNYAYAQRMYHEALQEAERLDPRGEELVQTLLALSRTHKASGEQTLADAMLTRACAVRAQRKR